MEVPDNHLRDSLVKLALGAKAVGLPFLLVGGNAVIHYGVPRFTRDIDFLVPEGSTGDWREFLEQSGFHCFHATDAFMQFDGLAPELPPVDLMIVGSDTWEKLLAAVENVDLVPDVSIPLPSPTHLLAMKFQAYRNVSRRAREQDWSDILHLVERYVPDRSVKGFCQMVLRHGGEQAWDRLLRELPPDQT